MVISRSTFIPSAFGAALLAGLAFSTPAPAGDFRLIELDGAYLKWGAARFGAPAAVTYSFVTSRTKIPKARNCSVLTAFSTLARPGLSVEAMKREFAAAAREWEKVADIEFHFVPDPAQAQILVGAQGVPRGRAFANVRYRAQSLESGLSPVSLGRPDKDPAERVRAGPIRSLDQALICLDAGSDWKIGFDGDLERYDLRYTFMHELGHAIGLNHPSPSGNLMSFRYEEAGRRPGSGDIAGVRLLYGSAGKSSRRDR